MNLLKQFLISLSLLLVLIIIIKNPDYTWAVELIRNKESLD